MALVPISINKPGVSGLSTVEEIPGSEDLLTFASQATNGVIGTTGKLESREDFLNQTSGFSGTVRQIYLHTSLANAQTMVSAADGQLYTGISTMTSRLDYRAGRQMVDVGGAKTGASATGLANDGTTYGFSVVIDGVTKHVSVVGSAAQTWTNLLSEINTDIGAAGTASIVAGNLSIKSATNGTSSTVAITDGPDTASTALLATLTGYVAIRTAEIGCTTGSDNWQFATLNGYLMAAQAGQRPRVWADSDFATETYITTGTGRFAQPNCVMAAWGRWWVADDAASGNQRKIWWANLLTNDFTTGDGGSIDLSEAWPDGSDRIIAIAALSNKLVIFGRTSILQYTLPADLDPTNMTLGEPIKNIGCVARDTVVNTGTDLLFLSDQGVMSLSRLTTIASTFTVANLTKNVQDLVAATVAAETAANFRCGFHPGKSWGLFSSPTQNKTYCLNMLRKLADTVTPAVTTWDNGSMPFRGFAYDKSGNFYTGGINGIYKYSGYTPDNSSTNAYSFTFYTEWVAGDETQVKLLKWVELTLKAGSGQTGTLYWRVDYLDGTTRSQTFTCSAAEFAENPGIGKVLVDIGDDAVAVKIGLVFPITSKVVQLQSMRILAGKGRIV